MKSPFLTGMTTLVAVAALVTSCGSPTAASAPSNAHKDALVAQYGFETITDGVVTPEVGTAPMTIHADSTQVAGKVGSYAIASTSGNLATQGASIDAALLTSDDTSLTVSAWLYNVTSDWENFVNIGAAAVDTGNIYYNNTIWTANADWNFQNAQVASGVSYNWAFSSGWTLITIVFDPDTGIRWYKDGQLKVTHPVSNDLTAGLISAVVAEAQATGDQHIWVAHNGGADPATTFDDLRFYNYALSDSQVSSLYSSYGAE